MSQGVLHILPIVISDTDPSLQLVPTVISTAKELRFFVVENVKTARRFLRKIDREFPIDESEFYQMDKHQDYQFSGDVIQKLKSGESVGLMSEAGYPGIADPGNQLVYKAHENGIKVQVHVGPSSLFLAMAASGLNGQGFTFNGYLPKKDNERIKAIKQLAHDVNRTHYAQLLIETPFRNQVMFNDLLTHLPNDIKLTVALDILGGKEFIQTHPVVEWKKKNFTLDKAPAVFIIG